MRKLARHQFDGVGHLHGIWTKPESVVLTEAEYAHLLTDETSQFLQQAYYLTKSFIFVGYGEGLNDPNFDKLLTLHGKLFPSSSGDHFRLVSDDDLAAATKRHGNDDIRVITYGSTHDSLPNFIHQLAPVSKAGKKPSHDGIAYARDALIEQIRQETVVAEHIPANQDVDLKDVAITPVLLPMPHEQFAAARSLEEEFRPERLDPDDVLRQPKVLIVVGDELTGLTTCLRWLAASASSQGANTAPIFVDARTCVINSRPLDRHIRKEALTHRLIDQKNDELPPYVLALDNLKPSHSRAYDATIEDLLASTATSIIVGCRPGDEEQIAQDLASHTLNVEICHLGKLAQKEVVEFARILAPTRADSLSEDVLAVIRREHLPRSPFTVSLLIVLFTRGSKTALHNSETAVLNEYISLMLGRNGQYLDPRWSLDPQNREVVLASLAKLFVKERKGAVTHHNAVEFIERIFRDLDWPDGAYDTLESFRAMKLIRISNDVVQFQQSSYLHLFAAKAAIGDEQFLQEMLQDPLYFAPILRHYAALVRNSEVVVNRMSELLSDWTLEPARSPIFTDVQAREAPADVQEEPAKPAELEQDYEKDETPQVSEPELRDEYDYSDDADRVPFPLSDPSTWDRASRLSWTLDLASRVVRDSDQITDRDLKSNILALVLDRWGLLLELFVLDGRYEQAAHGVASRMIDNRDLKESRREAMVDRLRLLLPSFIVIGGISATLSSRKLLRAFERLDDASDLTSYGSPMAGLLAFELQEKGWVQRLAQTQDDNARTWLRVEFLHLLGRLSYVNASLSPEDEPLLLEFLAETGALRFSFESDAARRRWMGRYEQRLTRERNFNKKNRLPRGAKAIEN